MVLTHCHQQEFRAFIGSNVEHWVSRKMGYGGKTNLNVFLLPFLHTQNATEKLLYVRFYALDSGFGNLCLNGTFIRTWNFSSNTRAQVFLLRNCITSHLVLVWAVKRQRDSPGIIKWVTCFSLLANYADRVHYGYLWPFSEAKKTTFVVVIYHPCILCLPLTLLVCDLSVWNALDSSCAMACKDVIYAFSCSM